jgi:hypothetical protein
MHSFRKVRNRNTSYGGVCRPVPLHLESFIRYERNFRASADLDRGEANGEPSSNQGCIALLRPVEDERWIFPKPIDSRPVEREAPGR